MLRQKSRIKFPHMRIEVGDRVLELSELEETVNGIDELREILTQ
jgi:hypothetical protein